MIEVNLFPWREYVENKTKNSLRLAGGLALVLAVVVLAIAHLILVKNSDQAALDCVSAQVQLDSVNKKLAEISKLYQLVDYKKLPAIDLDSIIRRQYLIINFLQKSAEKTPVLVYWRQIRFEKGLGSLEGVSTALPAIFQLSRTLPASAFDIKEKEGLYVFNLRFEQNV